MLTLPLWPGLSRAETDMLLCHEVGHALFTPWDAWKEAIHAHPKPERDAFQSYLNIVEDARIERKMKERWPGMKITFYNGYCALHHQRDIFKIRKEQITIDVIKNDKLRIDRLNLAAKIGGELGLMLESDDQDYYTRMMTTDTFDEVIALSNELFERQKQDQQSQPQAGEGQGDVTGADGQSGEGGSQSAQGKGQSQSGKGQGQMQKATNLDNLMGDGSSVLDDEDDKGGKGQANGQGKPGNAKEDKDGDPSGKTGGDGASSSPTVAMTDSNWNQFVHEQSGYDPSTPRPTYSYDHYRKSSKDHNTVTLMDVDVDQYPNIIEPIQSMIEKFRTTKSVTPQVLTALNEWRKEFTYLKTHLN